MATKKAAKSRFSTTKSKQTKQERSFFNFGESYTSLILGIVVVIIAAILLISFVRNRGNVELIKTDAPDISATRIGPDIDEERSAKYTVKEGDDLWTIAEQNYESGYNWVDIQKANNIENSEQITAGTELILPDVESKEKTTSDDPETSVSKEKQITGGEYTIREGDTLWSIAERRYSDGFQWVKIARANSLSNPDLILTGNTLKLP